jgi:hypothetical protein
MCPHIWCQAVSRADVLIKGLSRGRGHYFSSAMDLAQQPLWCVRMNNCNLDAPPQSVHVLTSCSARILCGPFQWAHVRSVLSFFVPAILRWQASKAPLNSETLSIAVGSVSLTLLLINRLATEELANAQSRSDLLGVAVCSALLLTAFSTIDLKVREKEEVELAGVRFDEVLVPLSKEQERTLRWAAKSITSACANAQSITVYARGRTVARLGIMGRAQEVSVGPIAESGMSSGKQQYLADLQILPGRFEFGYLPVNTQVRARALVHTRVLRLNNPTPNPQTPKPNHIPNPDLNPKPNPNPDTLQAILLQPLGSDAYMVIGANKIRAFTGRDLQLIDRLGVVAAQALEA